MKITAIRVRDVAPLREFEVSDLGAIVVFAGANGSGKTRLKNALINTFKNPKSPQVSVDLLATREKEAEAWGAERLVVAAGAGNQALRTYMGSRISGGMYVGTVIQVDSSRSVQPVNFRSLSLATQDPDDVEINYSYFLESFAHRWSELVNKIYEKAAARDHKIAQAVKAAPDHLGKSILERHPDPIALYQEVFAKLLPGKHLCAIDPKAPREFHYCIDNSESQLPFSSLSSGEQEVVKVAFDLTWKQIRHCTILIDEPELHLHPTLTFRLIETIKDLGEGTNQLFLFTHSADLVSTYYPTGNVFFIDSETKFGNQARQLSRLRVEHHHTARAVAANLGLFAVGKNLVFVEGKDASVDRLTYHRVAQKFFPEAYVLPIGSVDNIFSLRDVVAELTKTVFGIELFLVRDRDGLSDEAIALLEANKRVRCLPRRHIENYFFDPTILEAVAKRFCLDTRVSGSEAIAAALLDAAKKNVNTALVLTVKDHVNLNGIVSGPSVKDAVKKSLDAVEKELQAQVSSAASTLASQFAAGSFDIYVKKQRLLLESSLRSDEWKKLFPGKPVLASFCGEFWKIDVTRVQQAYADIALDQRSPVFGDLEDIMKHFRAQALPERT